MLSSCGVPDCDVDCKPFVCVDCSINTMHIDEYYMVTDEIWDDTGLTSNGGMLCIGCLEARLGRKLTARDFSDVPLNYFPWASARLLSRRSS
jgi:hypothetical protein